MSLFAVTREAGPGWTDGGAFEQPAVHEHAAFMNSLVEKHVIVLGGPIENEEENEALIVFDAPSETVVRDLLSQDPWASTEILLIRRIELWTILLDSRPTE